MLMEVIDIAEKRAVLICIFQCDIATQSIIKQEVTSLQRDLEASKNEVLHTLNICHILYNKLEVSSAPPVWCPFKFDVGYCMLLQLYIFQCMCACCMDCSSNYLPASWLAHI